MYRHLPLSRCAILLVGLAMAATAAAQDEPQASADPADTIVVTGEPEIEDAVVRRGVRDIARRGRNQYAPIPQYQQPLCVAAIGLDDASNARIVERIQANTLDVGLSIGFDGCEVNALIVIVDDQAALIENMRETQAHLFGPGTNRRIKAALKRNDPAIAWSAYRSNDPRGAKQPAPNGIAGAAGTAPIFDSAGQSITQTRSGGISRFKIAFSTEKVFTVVAFDADQLIGVHLDQLADFATMRTLADPQRRVELRDGQSDSILTLFDTGPELAPDGLTRLDRAFLKGLYTLRPNDPANRLEKFVISAYDDIREEDCAEAECGGQ